MYLFRRLCNRIRDFRYDRRMRRQRYKKGYADSDCWGMNYWLTSTFPDMILNLRNMKHSAPELPFEEFDTLPVEWRADVLKEYEKKCEEDDTSYDQNSIFAKWYVLLTRIAFCLKQADEDLELPNEYRDEFHRQSWGEDNDKMSFKEFWNTHFEKTDMGYVLKPREVDPLLAENYFKKETEILDYKEKMKDEAMDLIKKYFYNLWD